MWAQQLDVYIIQGNTVLASIFDYKLDMCPFSIQEDITKQHAESEFHKSEIWSMYSSADPGTPSRLIVQDEVQFDSLPGPAGHGHCLALSALRSVLCIWCSASASSLGSETDWVRFTKTGEHWRRAAKNIDHYLAITSRLLHGEDSSRLVLWWLHSAMDHSPPPPSSPPLHAKLGRHTASSPTRMEASPHGASSAHHLSRAHDPRFSDPALILLWEIHIYGAGYKVLSGTPLQIWGEDDPLLG